MVQVDWPTYSIPAMQIALISDFADELGVTSGDRGYEPPFIPRLGALADSMGIKDVSVTDVDAQMAIMDQIEADRHKQQERATTTSTPATSHRESGQPVGTSSRPPRALPPQPAPPQRRSGIDEYLYSGREESVQRTNKSPSRAKKEPVRRGSNSQSGRGPRGR